jgi:tRNA A-37 threonylcarbamoyl transferase component Bud32
MSADSPLGVCPRCALQVAMHDPLHGGVDPTVSSGGSSGRFVAPKPEQLAPHFPQLEILDLVGQGGMGAVYKARQRDLDRIVALKILPPETARDPTFAERFHREARALARLNHPHIVSVFDSGKSGGLFYFIMEYVDGINLRQAIQGRTISPQQSLAIVPQICDALQYAHDEGVVHRDIKPENILLDLRGRVKIADFGLARLLGKAGDAFTLTGANQVMGTPRYMAPEQLEGSHDVDHRADIYSLGVVFYEMLTRELPIGRFAPPSKKVQIDVRLDDVVLRTLEKEPSLRYQQASDVKSAVETINAVAQLPPHLRRMYGYEYRSRTELFGYPLVHIAYGFDPQTHRRRIAKGIVAVGDVAIGVLALGGMAFGVFACGGVAMGLMTLGGMSVGLLFAIGGGAVGLGLSIGGGAVGSFALGGCAVGIYAAGGTAFGLHAFQDAVRPGGGGDFLRNGWPVLQTALLLVVLAVPVVLLLTGFALWLITLRRNQYRGRGEKPPDPYSPARQPSGHGSDFAAGCAILLAVLVVCGSPVGLLVAAYAWLGTARQQQSLTIQQQTRVAERAAHEAAALPAELDNQRRSGLAWTPEGPVLGDLARRRLQLSPPQEQRVDEILRATFRDYAQAEREIWRFERLANGWSIDVRVPRGTIDALESRLWSDLDSLLTVEQQAVLRAGIRVLPASADQIGKNVAHPDVAMPGLLGWGREEARVEVSRKGAWLEWRVASQNIQIRGAGPRLPYALKRFADEFTSAPAAEWELPQGLSPVRAR